MVGDGYVYTCSSKSIVGLKCGCAVCVYTNRLKQELSAAGYFIAWRSFMGLKAKNQKNNDFWQLLMKIT